MPASKAPIRTCVACGHTDAKKALVRVVRLTDDQVSVDSTGKKPGRGAYLCPQASCLEAVKRNRRLDRALRTKINERGWDELTRTFSESYPQFMREQD